MANSTIPPPSLQPAVLPTVHLSLTIIYTALYSLLFIIIYVQLWMILYLKHRRLSYQSVFLFLCCFWSALRITLFSFYFEDAASANYLPTFWYWLLYCFPVCLQFMTLCLLVLFFAQVHLRRVIELGPNKAKRMLWIGTTLVVTVFLITNITCAVLINNQTLLFREAPIALIYTRVLVNDLLFILYGVLLSISIYNVSRLPSNFQVLESQGTTKRQAVLVGVLLVPLYVSRAVYNLVAITRPTLVTFGYSWINVSDQADVSSAENGFITFGIILFFWEFLPTFVVVMSFRVKIPKTEKFQLSSLARAGDQRTAAAGDGPALAYFFDNPRRYDSDEDLVPSSASGISEDVRDPYFVPTFLAAPRRPVMEQGFPQGTPPVLHANTGPLS